MTELIRLAYLRAVRLGAVCYGWTTYARGNLGDTSPDPTTCGGTFIAAHPSGRVDRFTYRADLRTDAGAYGLWMLTATATVDTSGAVIAAKEC